MNKRHQRQTHIFVIIFVLTNVLGNLALSRGMRNMTIPSSASLFDYVHAISPWTVIGVCILIIWMASDLALLSRADLSYVLPVTASSNVLIALAGHFWLHEHISAARWAGILVISAGVLLAETTPDRTTRRIVERVQ